MFVEPRPLHKITMQSLLLQRCQQNSKQSRLFQTATALSSPVDGKLNDLIEVSFELLKYQQVNEQQNMQDQPSDHAEMDEAQLELIRIFSNASMMPNTPINYQIPLFDSEEPIDRAHNPLPASLELTPSRFSVKLVRRFSI